MNCKQEHRHSFLEENNDEDIIMTNTHYSDKPILSILYLNPVSMLSIHINFIHISLKLCWIQQKFTILILLQQLIMLVSQLEHRETFILFHLASYTY